MPDTVWDINLLGRSITHIPTGLIIRFRAATDGSGAMQADLVNPEILPERATKEAIEGFSQLPFEAWQVYAEASEVALAKLDKD
jgi:hypothetical protein